ncbi:heparinase II/III family protein [Henriciella sp.]|uniref:heparinase II/III domain-containing protein n=1 Tax=Henriciella sp. TaxID=1968823 RepID=UPI00261B7A4E|nr:heparinase II/III family protein [Henriciella sp.]
MRHASLLPSASVAALLLGASTLSACTEGTATGQTSSTRTEASAPAPAPLFNATIEKLRQQIDTRMADGVPVPVPADAGGGYTHEQHKLNGTTIYNAGMLYRVTGEQKYRDFATDILLDYAELYPTLDLHPQVRPSTPSRLFWQGLNEAVWLVYAIQGYEAIRGDIDAEAREEIESQLIRPMADFLSEGSPQTFDRIHNHGTWSAAAVGMTGYVIDDEDMVEKALLGLDRSGEAGFLRQIDLLFSPDGYYAEGPYYQRYALMPFVLFADAIHRNDPDRDIFAYRDEVLLKAIRSTVQLSYAGRFFPINDAIREKGLDTAELHYGLAIAYDLTEDPSLLSIIQQQDTVVPTQAGHKAAQAIAAGKAEPFPFRTLKLRDGAEGDNGALMILRSEEDEDNAAVVFKATSQGLGHGHFDRLGLLYFDNGNEIVADYGAARFLNVEPKNGGRYLPENDSWAKQTVAHNTLVVDESSQFGADWKLGEEHAPRILAFNDTPGASYAAAEIGTAHEGVDLQRALALVDREGEGHFVIDIFRAQSDGSHSYDLPVHFKGQLIETSLPFDHATRNLAPLGEDAGYQHLWKTAKAEEVPAGSLNDLSILIEDRFYTMNFLVDAPMTAVLTRLGANDPNNNLRSEQALILRSEAETATYFSAYQAHGVYDNSRELTVYDGGTVENLSRTTIDGVDIFELSEANGKAIRLLFAQTLAPSMDHSIELDGETINWTGPVHLVRTSDDATAPSSTSPTSGDEQ